jgi:uncharacterized protein
MDFDQTKRRRNLHKHRLDLADCLAVFDSPMLTREDFREGYGEQRLISLGYLRREVVVLVWTDDLAQCPRIISCRKATPHEQEAYFKIYPQG